MSKHKSLEEQLKATAKLGVKQIPVVGQIVSGLHELRKIWIPSTPNDALDSFELEQRIIEEVIVALDPGLTEIRSLPEG